MLAPAGGLAKLLGHLDQFFHHLRGFNGAVLVALDHVAQQVGELLLLHHIAAEAARDLAFEQAFEQLYRQVLLG